MDQLKADGTDFLKEIPHRMYSRLAFHLIEDHKLSFLPALPLYSQDHRHETPFLIYEVLTLELRALCMLGKHSTALFLKLHQNMKFSLHSDSRNL